jgi:hypothetical protein
MVNKGFGTRRVQAHQSISDRRTANKTSGILAPPVGAIFSMIAAPAQSLPPPACPNRPPRAPAGTPPLAPTAVAAAHGERSADHPLALADEIKPACPVSTPPPPRARITDPSTVALPLATLSWPEYERRHFPQWGRGLKRNQRRSDGRGSADSPPRGGADETNNVVSQCGGCIVGPA